MKIKKIAPKATEFLNGQRGVYILAYGDFIKNKPANRSGEFKLGCQKRSHRGYLMIDDSNNVVEQLDHNHEGGI